MTRPGHSISLARAAAAFLLIWCAAPPSARPAADAAKASTVTCAFSNPGYSGWCRQSVAVPSGKTGRAACTDVLTCLNNAQCVRTYCNATSVRGAWRLEKVTR